MSVLLGPLSFLTLGKCQNLKVLPLCKLVRPKIWSPQTHTSKHWNLVTVASYIPSSTLICIILTVSLWADGLLCQHLCIRPSGALSPFSFQPRGTAVSPQLPLSYSVPFQTYITPFHFLQTSVTPQVGEKCKVEDPRVQLVMVNTDITHHVPPDRIYSKGISKGLLQAECLWPHPIWWNLIPTVMTLGGKVFGRWLDREDGSLINKISAHIKRTLESSLTPSVMWRYSKKMPSFLF